MERARRSLGDWLKLQQSVHALSIDMNLERVRAVAQQLQLLPMPCRVVTVAGTNGKGSTVAFLAAILRELGRSAGAFTSPHLLRYNERIRVDGQMVSDHELVDAFELIETARAGITLTFFEYNALAALLVFRRRQVEVALLEVGLGGRLDAVNIVDADVAIVCSIGFDHRDWLGDTLEAIGREKAGVFRRGAPAVLADPQMVPAVAAEARRLGAKRYQAQRDYEFRRHADGRWSFRMPGCEIDELPPPAMAGELQYGNAAAAIAALFLLKLPGGLLPDAVRRAIAGATVPGRFQIVPGAVEWILDVAHNEPAAQALAANLAARPVAGRTWIVAGILADKDIDAIARRLQPVVNEWILCGIDDPRGLAAEDLARRSHVFATARLAANVAAGVRLARELAHPGDRVVVCGSFLAVAPALEVLGLY